MLYIIQERDRSHELLSGGPLTLSLQMVTDALATFRANYRSPSGSSGFATPLSVAWTDFEKAVTSSLGATSPDRATLKYIHRYDPKADRWFLTVQICEIKGTFIPHTTTEYDLIEYQSFFNITANNKIEPYVSGLTDQNGTPYCAEYFANISDKSGAVNLATHAKSITFAWLEFKKLCTDNQTGRPDPTKFTIYFKSMSELYDLRENTSLVVYPHCLLMHMAYDGNDCLDNGNVVNGNFFNKAGDLNTICPPRCGKYLWSKDLN